MLLSDQEFCREKAEEKTGTIRAETQQSRLFYEFCSVMIQILRSPPLQIPTPITNPYSFPSPNAPSSSSSMQQQPPLLLPISQVSPAALASLFLGVSIALMLFGSVTFVIGFLLWPWVIGLVLIFYFVGFVSNMSDLGHPIRNPKDFPERRN